jgi:hypothetical protein
MVDYVKVSPAIWTGETGREIRAAGPEAIVCAFYLMSSPHADPLGIYSIPMLYIAHETGLGMEGASKGLRSCIEAGFCSYDEAAEVVWVHEMAAFQIAAALKRTERGGDKRIKWVNSSYEKLPKCEFLGDFFDKYAGAFHLERRRENHLGRRSSEGASKGLRSHQHPHPHQHPHQHPQVAADELELEDPEASSRAATFADADAPAPRGGELVIAYDADAGRLLNVRIWTAYAEAYEARYSIEPVRNAKVQGQISQLGKRLGSEAAAVAAFYVGHPGAYYVRTGHAVDALLRDAEKLRMEWATSRIITASEAAGQERTFARMSAVDRLLIRDESGNVI